MALTIDTLTVLNDYVSGVMGRADHHAQNVNEIVLTLAGAVIWRVTQDVEVRTHKEETANILWLTVNGHRYAVAYNHQIGKIEVRDRNQNDVALAMFDNSSSADIKNVFAKL